MNLADCRLWHVQGFAGEAARKCNDPVRQKEKEKNQSFFEKPLDTMAEVCYNVSRSQEKLRHMMGNGVTAAPATLTRIV